MSVKKHYPFKFSRIKKSIKRFRDLSFVMIIFPVFQTAFSLRVTFDINIEMTEIAPRNNLLKV